MAPELLISAAWEVTMDATTPDRERHTPHSTDKELLSTLRTMGPQTIEKLASLPGLTGLRYSWPLID